MPNDDGDDDMMDSGWRMVLEFDSSSPEFARGFECGRVYRQAMDGEPFTAVVHASNGLMMMRIGDATAMTVQATPTAPDDDEHWLTAVFHPTQGATECDG